MDLHRGRQATSDVLRALVCACLMLSAVVHLDLWATGMRSVDIVGPAFLLNGVGGIVLGVLVLVWRHWLPLLGAIGFGVATLGAFILATTPGGLFEVHSRWSGTPEWLAAISEIGVIALGIVTIVVGRRPPAESADLAHTSADPRDAASCASCSSTSVGMDGAFPHLS
ncbi:hypothetical protein [Cellulomonas sp. S1-8]|uniref:hypothetical protein n=1 Tax=Cellulomonas sp. S1-8 TaxID=2904790 RepID=UPI00224428F7|nr:hypothetical protein [Cellulomonas sp. S1-8]UZN03809.1 hypothetical protein OKX07_02375 [Cellulomonas sp. S1-8]